MMKDIFFPKRSLDTEHFPQHMSCWKMFYNLHALNHIRYIESIIQRREPWKFSSVHQSQKGSFSSLILCLRFYYLCIYALTCLHDARKAIVILGQLLSKGLSDNTIVSHRVLVHSQLVSIVTARTSSLHTSGHTFYIIPNDILEKQGKSTVLSIEYLVKL